jgi:hypothetical protein
MSPFSIVFRLAVCVAASLIIGCDPADIREYTIPIKGEKDIQVIVSKINAIAVRHGFAAGDNNGIVQKDGSFAAWRRKLNAEDESTRIALFLYFDSNKNTCRGRLILFPGSKLPPDSIEMFSELKSVFQQFERL